MASSIPFWRIRAESEGREMSFGGGVTNTCCRHLHRRAPAARTSLRLFKFVPEEFDIQAVAMATAYAPMQASSRLRFPPASGVAAELCEQEITLPETAPPIWGLSLSILGAKVAGTQARWPAERWSAARGQLYSPEPRLELLFAEGHHRLAAAENRLHVRLSARQDMVSIEPGRGQLGLVEALIGISGSELIQGDQSASRALPPSDHGAFEHQQIESDAAGGVLIAEIVLQQPVDRTLEGVNPAGQGNT